MILFEKPRSTWAMLIYVGSKRFCTKLFFCNTVEGLNQVSQYLQLVDDPSWCVPENTDCCWLWLMFRQPVWKSPSESYTTNNSPSCDSTNTSLYELLRLKTARIYKHAKKIPRAESKKHWFIQTLKKRRKSVKVSWQLKVAPKHETR